MASGMSVALASAVLFSCLGPLSVLGSAWSPSNAITSVKTTRAGSGCAFGFMLLQVRDPLQGGRLPPQARTGARRAVCLNNERNRPKESDRFCLPRSPLEGKFVPVNERMTFLAEMKALDALEAKALTTVVGMLNEKAPGTGLGEAIEADDQRCS